MFFFKHNKAESLVVKSNFAITVKLPLLKLLQLMYYGEVFGGWCKSIQWRVNCENWYKFYFLINQEVGKMYTYCWSLEYKTICWNQLTCISDDWLYKYESQIIVIVNHGFRSYELSAQKKKKRRKRLICIYLMWHAVHVGI